MRVKRFATALLALSAALWLTGCAMLGPGATSTPGTSASATPTETQPSSGAPPLANLLHAAGEQEGHLGAYAYRDSFSDPPFWPTADSLTRVELAAADEQLAVELPPGTSFVAWSARYAARDDHEAETVFPLGSAGAVDSNEPIERAIFDGPPTGEWLVEVALTFADGDGSANYYWLVAVP